jgi:hypothetical protein
MENLTDAGNRPKRSGLARLKRIRDEMFKKKHQTLKEEDAKEGNIFNQFFTSMLGSWSLVQNVLVKSKFFFSFSYIGLNLFWTCVSRQFMKYKCSDSTWFKDTLILFYKQRFLTSLFLKKIKQRTGLFSEN